MLNRLLQFYGSAKNPKQIYRKLSRRYRPMKKKYRARFNLTLKSWLLHHQKTIVFKKCSWMGIRAMKNPMDAWIYQEIIYEVKPGVIIEIGSKEGGSTLYLANLLDLLGKGTVISIDIDHSDFRPKHPRIQLLTGDSSSSTIVGKTFQKCRGEKVMIIHDGGHSKTQVLQDLRLYNSLVSIGSYFIVEDGIIDLFTPGDGVGDSTDGPLAAIEEFLATNPQFIIDEERERYLLTYNPMGFLKRVT